MSSEIRKNPIEVNFVIPGEQALLVRLFMYHIYVIMNFIVVMENVTAGHDFCLFVI